MTHARVQPLSGAPNFRDLGGYCGDGGRTVRYRRLFRSDHLGNLAPADLSALASSLGESIRVLDLRGEAERVTSPCAIPGASVHSLPIEPTIVQNLSDLLAAGRPPTQAQTVALMQDTYRSFVRGNTPRFAELFRHVLDANEPHRWCSIAPRARTAPALPRRWSCSRWACRSDVVMQDYLLTNAGLRQPHAAARHTAAIHSVLWSVQDRISCTRRSRRWRKTTAGWRAICAKGWGWGRRSEERLRQLYLEPPLVGHLPHMRPSPTARPQASSMQEHYRQAL